MTYAEFKTKYGLRLNTQQEAAVQAVEGPVLLLAVPGSGKTTVLVTRLGYMLFVRDIAPEHILTMTYTVAATADMRGRFAALFGDEMAQKLEFRTINGVSARIIRLYERLYGRKAFELQSDEKTLSALVGELYRQMNREFPTDSDIKAVRTAITYAKNRMLTAEEIEAMDKDLPHFSGMYRLYNQSLRERGFMDYDDQMVYAYQILRRYPEVLEQFQNRYPYICVDEAQDTSKIQHRIIALLAKKSGNLFMVGDEDQSIYGFRAAYPEALLAFEQEHPGARVLLMEENYRSTPQIVELADKFIRQSPKRRPKEMRAVRPEGAAVRTVELGDRHNQYSYLLKVAEDCQRETAILYRDNDCAMPLLDLFVRQGISFRCRQMDGQFFSNRVIRDLTDIIRLAIDPADSEIFMRVYYKLGAGISKAAAEFAVDRNFGGRPLLELVCEDAGISEWTCRQCRALLTHMQNMLSERADKAIYRIVHFMGYGTYLKERNMDVGRAQILEALGAREPNPIRLLDRLEELQAMLENGVGDPASPLVLSTIHSSKGLEYERVFLMDVLDGVLPKNGEDVDLDEERRLFYVGMTRAKDELVLFTFRKEDCEASFVRSLFSKRIQTGARSGGIRGITAPGSAAPIAHLVKDYIPGVRVSHRQFGSGILEDRREDLITIAFSDGSRRKLSLETALRAGALSIRREAGNA